VVTVTAASFAQPFALADQAWRVAGARALSDRDPAIQQNVASIRTLGRRTLVSP